MRIIDRERASERDKCGANSIDVAVEAEQVEEAIAVELGRAQVVHHQNRGRWSASQRLGVGAHQRRNVFGAGAVR